MTTPVSHARRKLKHAIKDYADAQVALSKAPTTENNNEVLVGWQRINDRIKDLEYQVRRKTDNTL